MGCDIHIFVEIRKNDKWEYFNEDHFSNVYSHIGESEKTNAPFDWRSYNMFSFLAGVRGGDIKPIKEPACDIPEDVSENVKNKKESWDGDGHSHSFLTARELVEFDYNQDLREPGQEFSTNSRNTLLEKMIIEEEKDDYNDDNCKTYFDYLGGPDTMFFKHIKELSELGNLDDVRVVFWFDN